MKIIYLKDKSEYIDNLTITIGNFDGLHLGHQKLVKVVESFSDTKTAALTFNPHPITFFTNVVDNITTLDEKECLFKEKTNLDYLIVVDFNQNFASLSPLEFIKYLKTLGTKRVVVGEDFKFGHKAAGNVDLLKQYFETIVMEEITTDSFRVSSTLIRELIKKGDIEKANYYLSYPYFINGYIEKGNQVGRTLGFPTANINYGLSLLPKDGVYITIIEIDGIKHYGVTNIGNNPTVNYSEVKKLEVFILNYSDLIYQKQVRLEFIKRIRDEIKFPTVEALKKQMNNDVEFTKKYIKTKKI